MPKLSAILPVNSNLLKQNTDPLLFLLPWHSSARSYSKGPHSEARHHRFSYFLLSNLLLVYACKYSEYNPKPSLYLIFLSSHLIYLLRNCLLEPAFIHREASEQTSSHLHSPIPSVCVQNTHICTPPLHVFAYKTPVSALLHPMCREQSTHICTIPHSFCEAAILVLRTLWSVSGNFLLRHILSSSPLLPSLSLPSTPKSYKLYVPFHRLVQRISTVFTKKLDCFYEEARLFLRRSSTIST